jgi:hypothetical protein
MRINEKSFNKKNLIIKSFLAVRIEKKKHILGHKY